MAIERAIEKVLKKLPEKSETFKQQLERYDAFRKELDRAGVAPKKQEFTIPLIERIGATVPGRRSKVRPDQN